VKTLRFSIKTQKFPPLRLHQVGWGESVHSHFQISLEMFNQVQIWALMSEPLKDIHRVVLKPLLCYLGCVLWVVVLLEDEPSHRFEIQSALKQVIIKDVSVHCCIHLSLDPD